MESLIMTVQLLVGLMFLVAVHEAGHMLTAKMFGMRVEKFSIGFPPKVFSFKYGETEYSLGLLPLGGFVKISGMIDESMDTESMKKDPEPWEFRAKPTWQRLIVMMGGIIVNLIVGVIIFICLNFIYGKPYLPNDRAIHGIHAYELAQKMGLESGDKILKANGSEIKDFHDILHEDVLFGDSSYYTVQRKNGTIEDVYLPVGILDSLSSDQPFLSYAFPYEIGMLVADKPAQRAGLLPGDRIITVNGESSEIFHELQAVLQKYKGQTAKMQIVRGKDTLQKNVPIEAEGIIGFMPTDLMRNNFDTLKFSLAESIPLGTKEAFNVIWMNIRGFGKIFSGQLSASKSLSGPIGIATKFGGDWVPKRFWYMVGLLSMVLAFMNFLPIPALDGGHVVFLLYEMITGHKPSDRFMEIAVKIGISLLIALMLFAFGNDIFRHIISKLF